NDDIDMTIAIEIADCDAQRFARLRKSGLLCDLSEMPVPVVVISERSNRLELIRMAERSVTWLLLATPDVSKIPLDITQYDKVEQPIAAQIYPRRASGPTAARHSGFVGDICESTIAIVVVKMVAAVARDEQIFKPIIVVIANGHPHSVSGTLESRFFGHVFKCTVGFLVVQAVPILRPCLLRDESIRGRIINFSAVHNEEIKPAIVVIVEECDSSPHSLK